MLDNKLQHLQYNDIKDKIPAIDLFAGAGGLSCGLINSGFDMLAAVEIDLRASETYRKNIGDIVLNKDISSVTGKELLDYAGLSRGDMFLMAGCPPCQGFSSIGLRNSNDLRNQLAFQFVRLIIETRPWFIVMENVTGMSRGNGKLIFKEVCEMLEEHYDICYEILNSADYGVPQQRKRLVLHGISKKIKDKYFPTNFILDMPEQSHQNPDKDRNEQLKKWETVSVINTLPKIVAGESSDLFANHTCRRLSDLNLKRIKSTSHNGGSRTEWEEKLVLECHKKNVGYKDVYGRMDSDKVAPTITAGCLSYSKGRFGHPTQDRAISAREAARLQTFPDGFEFFGTLTDISKQIGNAVPPKLAEASGNHIYKSIKKYILESNIKE